MCKIIVHLHRGFSLVTHMHKQTTFVFTHTHTHKERESERERERERERWPSETAMEDLFAVVSATLQS